MTDELIEAVAKAIHESDKDRTVSWEQLLDLAARNGYYVAKRKRDQTLAKAKAAIAAIEALRETP